MSNPYLRLAIRALLAGIVAAATSWQADGIAANAVVAGVLGFAILASAEITTPINNTVGVGKDGDA